MANSDYTKRSIVAGFCPKASISGALTRLATTVSITGLVNSSGEALKTNRAAMIDDEIVAITGIAGNVLTIARGCCDTIPQPHSSGATIWFFDDYLASDRIEYTPTDTIAVKPLPRTLSGGEVPIANSPPEQVTFNRRFARPYPPGNLLVNGSTWFSSVFTMTEASPNLVLTWAHRNRVTQQDLLIGHGEASITPEVGTTYRIKLRRPDNSLGATINGITAETYTLERAAVAVALGAGGVGYAEVFSVRDSLESFQGYRIDFTYEPLTGVTSDLAASWSMSGSVLADLVGSYAMSGSVQRDLSASYNVASSTSVWNSADKAAAIVLSSGDTVASITSASGGVRGTVARDASGDWYFELLLDSSAGQATHIHGSGIGKAGAALNSSIWGANSWCFYSMGDAPSYAIVGGAWNNGTRTGSYGSAHPSLPTRIGVRVSAGSITYYRNGVSLGVAASGITGLVFPQWGHFGSNPSTHSARLCTAAADILYLPSGATAWG